MSSEKVQQFLQKEQEEREYQEVQLRYKVLSHFDLGEIVECKRGDNEEDFPLQYPSGNRFRYDCEISDEDYEKVLEAYNQVVNSTDVDSSAEKTLKVCANILSIFGILSFIILIIVGIREKSWTLVGIGAGVFFTCLIEAAFAEVLVNISRKLNHFVKKQIQA